MRSTAVTDERHSGHASDRPTPDLVVLVHGTGSASPYDEGDRWWQRGSAFWRDFDEALAPRAMCGPTDGPLFHWSGLNSEIERRKAGKELHNWLARFEVEGRPYHLVGHSHGGSLILAALHESAKQGHPLRGLRSWCTIGTPFLQYRLNRAGFYSCLPVVASSAGLVLSASAIRESTTRAASVVSEGFTEYLAVIGVLWLLVALSGLYAGWRVVKTMLQVRRIAADRSAADLAWTWYGSVWRGISSPDDEAINGLVSTIGVAEAVVPRLRRGPIAWFYNRIIARVSDEFVWDRVMRRLQGADISTLTLCDVRRTPHDTAIAQPLTADVITRLLDFANEHAALTLASVRNALGLAAQSSDRPALLTGVQRQLSWNELIHNSYFALPEIRRLLAARIVDRDEIADPIEQATRGSAVRRRTLGTSVRLLEPTAALLFTGSICVATWAAQSVYDGGVATFTDGYQVAQVIDAVRIESAVSLSRLSDETIAAWIDSVVRSGNSDAAVASAIRAACAECTGDTFVSVFGHVFAALVGHQDLDRAIRMSDQLAMQHPRLEIEHGLARAVSKLTIAAADIRRIATHIQSVRPQIDKAADQSDGRGYDDRHHNVDQEMTAALARALAREGDIEAAMEQVNALDTTGTRQLTALAITQQFITDMNVDGALRMLGTVSFRDETVRILPSLARALRTAGWKDHAAAAAAHVLELSRGEPAVAKDLAEAGMASHARTAAINMHRYYRDGRGNLQSYEYRTELIEVAKLLAKQGHLADASMCLAALCGTETTDIRRAIATLNDPYVAADFSQELAQGGRLDLAIEIAAALPPAIRVKPLRQILGSAALGVDQRDRVARTIVATANELPPVPDPLPYPRDAALNNTIEALGEAVAALADSGFPDAAFELLDRVPRTGPVWTASTLLIAREYARTGRLDSLQQLIGRGLPSTYSIEHSPSVGREVAAARNEDEARAIAARLEGLGLRADAAMYLARHGLANEALERAWDSSTHVRDSALRHVVLELARQGHVRETASILERVEARDSRDLFLPLVDALLREKRFKEALYFASRVPLEQGRLEELARVAAAIPYSTVADEGVVSLLKQARTQINTHPEPTVRWRLLAQLGQAFSHLGDYRSARLACESISLTQRVECFTTILQDYARSRRQ